MVLVVWLGSHRYRCSNLPITRNCKIKKKKFPLRINDVEHAGSNEKDLEYLENKDYTGKGSPKNYTVHFPNMFRLSKRLELATRMNVTDKHSSTMYQVKNYFKKIPFFIKPFFENPNRFIFREELPKTVRQFPIKICYFQQSNCIPTQYCCWLFDHLI